MSSLPIAGKPEARVRAIVTIAVEFCASAEPTDSIEDLEREGKIAIASALDGLAQHASAARKMTSSVETVELKELSLESRVPREPADIDPY